MHTKFINSINRLPHHQEEVLLADPIPASPEGKEEYPTEPGPILSEHSLYILQKVTGSFLDAKEMAALAQTSKRMNGLFKEDMTVRKLLRHAAFGEPNEMMLMIKKDPALLLAKGDVTLPSGDHFKDIFLFQLLKWGHDPLSKTIWHALLEQSKEDAIRQFEQSESKETDYVKKHGRYYDFAPLEKTYRDFKRDLNQWKQDQRDAYWCEKIGGQQSRVPVWVAQCFCSGTTWHNNNPQEAQFNAITNNSRVLTFYDYRSVNFKFWFPLDHSGLGKYCAIYSQSQAAGMAAWWLGGGRELESNLAAISHLHGVSLSLQTDLADLFSVARRLARTL